MNRVHQIAISAFFLLQSLAHGGEVTIVEVRFEHHGSSWTAHTTLKHGDTGWKHYADAWRVVSQDGKVLGERTLYHPHVDEQPFTRSLSGIEIPASVKIVFIEAHDLKHGWSTGRLRVDLSKASGERFEVKK